MGPVEGFRRDAIALAQTVRDRVLAIPAAIGPRPPRGDVTNEVLRLLDNELRTALETLAAEGEAAAARIEHEEAERSAERRDAAESA